MKSMKSVVTAASLMAAGIPATIASEDLLRQQCLGCHQSEAKASEPLSLSRISHQRKTPEGWSMTIARMQQLHGLQISDDKRKQLVKYLADTQGIAPEEAQPYRYILERRLNHQEQKQPQLAEMCARCHSEARIGLQRREQAEWDKLVHFHVGQWPSIEFSAMGRDRAWFDIATTQVVPFLGEHYGFDQGQWQQWIEQSKSLPEDVSGRWRLVGSAADKGDFDAVMTVTATEDDHYQLSLEGKYSNGDRLEGEGRAVVYSGFEWRGSLSLNGVDHRQVFALNHQQGAMSGRMFEAQHEEMGVDVRAQLGDEPSLMAVSPAYIKAGTSTELSLRGNHLAGTVRLPKGISVTRVLSQTSDEIRLLVDADENLRPKRYSVAVGSSEMSNALAIFDRIARLEISPNYAVARVGGDGPIPKVHASFRAQAHSAGGDGELNTDDDFFIGSVNARWRIEPFDQQAVDDRDLEFVGKMNPSTGVFTPAAAGPNPNRKYGTNNAGRLSVIATVDDGQQTIEADGELIVTVQRWNNPPIK